LGTCAVQHDSKVYLYYTAYNLRVTVPYSNSIGLAVSTDHGVTFERMFEGPVVDRSMVEPYFTISPWVLIENEHWHMWYASATGWITVGGKPESLYHIKYASSSDGVIWSRENLSCIPPQNDTEANARPTVVREEGRYKMWFCYRGSHSFRDGDDSYRIGYAESTDGTNWSRLDAHAGIQPGPDEWDSLMQAYPAVVKVGGKTYLFYNGNGFGVQGFGAAVWE
jgi:hypothetical protein